MGCGNSTNNNQKVIALRQSNSLSAENNIPNMPEIGTENLILTHHISSHASSPISLKMRRSPFVFTETQAFEEKDQKQQKLSRKESSAPAHQGYEVTILE